MKKEKLENKQDKTVIENKSKSKNKYKVIESFCGIEKDTILTINDKQKADHMLAKKYVKKC